MYESPHGLPSDCDLRQALRLLDRAVAEQQARLRQARDEQSGDGILQALRRSVRMMEQEAQRLRESLPRG
jgi:hypothetical protein